MEDRYRTTSARWEPRPEGEHSRFPVLGYPPPPYPAVPGQRPDLVVPTPPGFLGGAGMSGRWDLCGVAAAPVPGSLAVTLFWTWRWVEEPAP